MTTPPVDTNGREFARLSQLKVGDKVQAATGFECIDPGAILTVHGIDNDLYVVCNEGRHYLGVFTGSDSIVGFYPVNTNKES